MKENRKTLRVALAQMNALVGGFDTNVAKIARHIAEATRAGADLILLPELALCGYPPEDLLLKPSFLRENKRQLDRICRQVGDIIAVAGFANRHNGKPFNAAAVMHQGELRAIYHKICLPNYSVFDEKRNFEAGRTPLVLEVDGIRIGINICEDIWLPNGVSEHQAHAGGASLICNISASPYYKSRRAEREDMLATRARACNAHVAYLSMVGGQDELVFDGGTFIYSPDGELLLRGPLFKELLLIADIELQPRPDTRRHYYFNHAYHIDKVLLPNKKLAARGIELKPQVAPAPGELEEILLALVLGTRDYVQKNGFKKVVIGLSGGIDSALTAAIAQQALGAENVIGVLMPSRFTSQTSLDDATALAKNLGIETHTIAIEEIVADYEAVLAPIFGDRKRDITEENLQARARGNILMALSNKFGWMVLTTGNKSETSVGYCTLYGDMAGGFAVLKDVLKTLVFELALFINRDGEVIPENTITKPPSAELRPDQKDEDSLPPYALLDEILIEYVERDRSVSEIVARGFEPNIVREVVKLVDRNEYKRRQAPPGIKITPKAFGRDRRMPITNHFTSVEINNSEGG